MSRFTLILLSLFLLAAGNTRLMAYALIGPFLDWQTDEIGYNVGGDLGGPMNVGNEYRRNTSEMFYSFDEDFINFFGAEGMNAVSNAFDILNQLSKTNLSLYSSNLAEFPLNTLELDDQVAGLGLRDLKSSTLSLMMEQLGLAQPGRFTWALRTRFELDLDDIDCPANVVYNVIQRNFAVNPNSLTNVVYSSTVNDLDITDYEIFDDCGDGPPPQSDAFNLPSQAVAEYRGIPPIGSYFTGLTRDDVAGLRYMLSAQNVNLESTGPSAFAFVTNTLQELLNPSDLTSLTQASATNTAAELEALFPGLVVAATSNYFVNVVTTNIVAYFTNSPFAPAGSPPQLVVTSILTTNVDTRYVHTFGNVIIQDGPYPYCRQTLLSTTVGPDPYAPVGSGGLKTNSTSTPIINTKCVSGSYFILPAGACDFHIVSTQLTQVVTFTNVVYDVSTSVDQTNSTGFYAASQSILSYWTNRTLVGRAVTCPENVGGLRRGIEKTSYFQRDYDSLLGQLFTPFTNYYDMVVVANSQNQTQRVGRVVSQPDFRLTVEDLVTPEIFFVVSRNLSFSTNSGGGGPGPGTVIPSSTLTFNNVGLAYFGGPSLDTNVFLNQDDFSQQFLWGSFGGTTNANDPVVYPNGVSIQDVENILLMQITTPSLPAGKVGVGYLSAGFTGQGGTPPYIWNVAPFSYLPPGLSLPNPVSGNIAGIPTTAGIYDFDIRMTDSAGRFVDRAFTLTINAP